MALSLRDLAAYGVLALPLAFAGLPIYLHAPEFYARSLGLPLTQLGLALLALRAVDALQDPLIGALSDRYSRHRRGIIAVGAGLLGSGFWMLFHPVPDLQLLWFCLSVFICTTGFSIASINLQALGGIWIAAPHERTRITSWREAFGLAGLLAASIGPALLGGAEDPAKALHLLSLAFLPLLLTATIILLKWVGRVGLLPQPGKSQGPGLCGLVTTPWRRPFFSLFALNTFASAIPAVLVLFFIQDRLQARELSGVFLLLYFLSGILAMPVWQGLSRRFGKLRSWGLSMALSIATFIWAAFVGAGDTAAYGIICALAGLALGADLALPPSILADRIDRDEAQGEASRLYALMTLLSKGALAAATGLALPLLGLAGYRPGIEMTPQLDLWLSLSYAVLPSALKLAALVLLVFSAARIASATTSAHDGAHFKTTGPAADEPSPAASLSPEDLRQSGRRGP